MTREQRPVTYRQRDLAAAMRAAKQTGIRWREIYIDRDGRIVIVAANEDEQKAEAAPEAEREWDKIKI